LVKNEAFERAHTIANMTSPVTAVIGFLLLMPRMDSNGADSYRLDHLHEPAGGCSDEIYFIFDDKAGSGHYTSGTMKSIDEEPKDKYHTVHPGETFSFTNTVDLDIFEDDSVGIFWGPS